MTDFSDTLLGWFDDHGRKNLPWQCPRTAYRVWVSEIMLQQTQVKTVISYFQRFMNAFPDVGSLATASEDAVLSQWSGLGYYRRALNLHKAAQIVCTEHQGELPQDITQLTQLPGIGLSTAAAIASQAFNLPTAILDANATRVYSRYFLIHGISAHAHVKKKLWHVANTHMPTTRCADYTQAIMDLGATCCTARDPQCTVCPLQKTCEAYSHQQVDRYPEKKPSRSLPHKQQQFLLLFRSDHRIYLEKRPSEGIWAGLWCPPAIDTPCCPIAHIQQTYSWGVTETKEFMRLKHTFSHFHLEMIVQCIPVKISHELLAQSPGGWFNKHELQQLGLAKPVSTLLRAWFGEGMFAAERH